jgi:hypothetical protein
LKRFIVRKISKPSIFHFKSNKCATKIYVVPV